MTPNEATELRDAIARNNLMLEYMIGVLAGIGSRVAVIEGLIVERHAREAGIPQEALREMIESKIAEAQPLAVNDMVKWLSDRGCIERAPNDPWWDRPLPERPQGQSPA